MDLTERFAAAKEQKELAEKNLKAVLLEMVEAGLAKVVEDSGSEFPDIIVVAPKRTLEKIDTYEFEDVDPTFLDGEGYPVEGMSFEELEWF
jgi:hypothetical protein